MSEDISDRYQRRDDDRLRKAPGFSATLNVRRYRYGFGSNHVALVSIKIAGIWKIIGFDTHTHTHNMSDRMSEDLSDGMSRIE